MRTLRKDYARYSKGEDPDLDPDLGDEYGWYDQAQSNFDACYERNFSSRISYFRFCASLLTGNKFTVTFSGAQLTRSCFQS